jgi:hypothetical protein
MSTRVEMYKCDICGKAYTKERDAVRCEIEHKKEDYANILLNDGWTLKMIKDNAGVLQDLPEELNDVDKNSRFKISYLQGRDDCFYMIAYILNNEIKVTNIEDYYTSTVDYNSLCHGLEKDV